MKTNTIKNKKNFFIIISLLLILFMKLEFFRDSYFVINKSFNERFINAYNKNYFSGFCSKEAHGYIKYIQNKFKLDNPPKIMNFSDKRRKVPYWIFYKNKNKVNNDELIIVNFKPNKKIKFGEYLIKDNYNNNCFYLIKK